MIRILFRVLLAIIIAMVGYWYFSALLPPAGAMTIAVIIAFAELAGSLFARGGSAGAGGGMRVVLRSGLPLLTWPGFAWLLVAVGVGERDLRIALAATAACLLGAFAAHHGQGRNQYHLLAILVVASIALTSLAVALLSGSRHAVAAGCLAVAVAVWVTRASHPWGDAQAKWLATSSAMVLISGAAVFATSFVF